MQLDHYGPDRPFRSTPDPGLFYPSARHERALSAIVGGLRERCGLLMLVGEIGTGKTTLCNYIRANFTVEFHLGYCGNPFFTKHEFLRHVCDELGIGPGPDEDLGPAGGGTGPSGKDHLDRLTAFLRARHEAGETVVLILDEAHLLNPPLFEILLILFNLQSAGMPLLQTVLVGQTELLDVLRQPRLASLNQRIAIRQRLGPLSRSDTVSYVGFRLTQASMPPDLFTPAGLGAVWKVTRGTPRLINQLCGRVLDKARLEGKSRIGRREIVELADDPAYASLFGRKPAQDRWRRLLPAAAACALLAAGLVAAGSAGRDWLHQPPHRQQAAVQRQVQEARAIVPDRPAALLPAPASYDLGDLGDPGPLRAAAAPVQAVPAPEARPVQGAPARQAEPTYAMRTALKPAVRPGGNAGKPAGEARAAAADPRPGELIPVAAGAKAGPPAPISQAAQPVQATPAGGASSPVPESAAPDIRLSAIAWDADPARRIVIMNDRILHEGETLGQTKVARIEADHVELIRDGLSVVKRLKDDSGR